MSSRSPELPDAFLGPPIAHRGLHDRGRGVVENSRAAIAAAVAAGYGVEIDVQQAACGEAMVFHDATLDRLTGRRGRVDGLTAAELARVTLAGTGESVPTLAEVLELVAGRAALLIEIKDQDGALGPGTDPLARRTAEVLAGYHGPVAAMSFNPVAVATFGEVAADRSRGLVACPFTSADWSLPDYRRAELAGLADFDRVGAAFVSHDRRDLDNPAIAALRARGVPILCWTVRSPAEEADARRVANNITFEAYEPATGR